MPLLLTPTELTLLKTATLDLVKAVGGIDRASLLRGLSRSQVARWYAPRDERDPSQPSSVVIDAISIIVLERDLQDQGDTRRPVTECLARLNGCGLMPADGLPREPLAATAARIARTEGELTAQMLELDDHATPTTVDRVDRIAADLDAATHDLRDELAARRQKIQK